MNKLFTGVFFLLMLILSVGCSKDDDDDDDLQGDWMSTTNFEGVSRSDAVSFVINDKAYVGTGFTSNTSENVRLRDFWMYDPDTENWKMIPDFPGTPRSKAVAFTAGGKGYVGLGTADGTTVLKDFWEYDPSTNIWRQVADFPAAKGRVGAVAFGIGNEGYVGSGTDADNDQQDFYKFTPGTGSSPGVWTQVASIKSKREDAFCFVINNKAYVGGGKNNGSYVDSFYSYDPSTNTWTKLHSLYPDGSNSGESDEIKANDDYNYNLQRSSAVAFTLNGYGYLTVGSYSAVLNTTWQYSPDKDIWTQVDSFEGSSREGAAGFALKNIGYVTTGRSGTTRMDDLWKFDPNASDDD